MSDERDQMRRMAALMKAFKSNDASSLEVCNHARDIDFDLVVELLECMPSPCGHSSQYTYTEDGGAHMVCLLCARSAHAHLAEILWDGWREIGAFFAERNWPDTKLGNAAAAINGRIGEMTDALRGEPVAGAATLALAELERLRGIEHMAWHFLESGAEHIEDKKLVFELPNEDYDKLIALLPEGHP